jgi:hypothetical protein
LWKKEEKKNINSFDNKENLGYAVRHLNVSDKVLWKQRNCPFTERYWSIQALKCNLRCTSYWEIQHGLTTVAMDTINHIHIICIVNISNIVFEWSIMDVFSWIKNDGEIFQSAWKCLFLNSLFSMHCIKVCCMYLWLRNKICLNQLGNSI